MVIKKIFTALLFTIFSYNVYTEIVIQGVTTSENGGYNAYNKYVKEFNDFSKREGLNITFNLELLSRENYSVGVTDYEIFIESLFLKESEKYDLIFFDNIFTPKFGPHLADLSNFLKEEHINMYKSGIASISCVYKKKWVAIPTNVDFSVLYYNDTLLTRFKKEVPKTWDKLYETAREIKGALKDDNIIYYNGMLDDTEFGTISLYEFLYTFRKNKESGYPDLNSNEVKEALKMLKKLKTDLSSDEIFKKDLYYTYNKVMDGEFLFSKYWYTPDLTEISKKFMILPGNNEECSGSVLGGYNLGINKYISTEKQEAAAKILEYLTSEDVQKGIVKHNKIASALQSVYDDEEVCKVENIDCEVFKNKQLVKRPVINNYDDWSKSFRTKVYEYLYGGKSVDEVASDLQKTFKDFHVSSAPKKSLLGLFIYLSIFTVVYTFFNL